jgi:hypothetical protein
MFAIKFVLRNRATGLNMRYRDVHERHISAKQREKLAADRATRATTEAEKEKARRWVEAWGAVARVHPLRRS